MKKLIFGLLVAAAGAVFAGGWSATYSLSGGTVALSNTQANSSWVPVAVLLKLGAAGSGTVEVSRVSQSHSYTLTSCVFSNASTVVWVPEAAYCFGLGDALVVQSSATNAVVQIIRKGD